METRFSSDAQRVLDELEQDPDADELFDATWDMIEFVADHPDSAEARRRGFRTPEGQPVWLVPIRNRYSKEPWVLLWQRQGDEALIAYIGPDDFRPGGKK